MKKTYFLIALLILPSIACAQTGNVDDVLNNFMNILVAISKMLVPAAMLYFFYQLIQFIRASNAGTTTIGKSKDTLIYSGIILFVMVGIWAIIGYVQQSIGTSVTTTDIRKTPTIPTELPPQ